MPSGVADFGASTWSQALFGLVAIPDHYYLALCSDEPGQSMDGDVLSDLEPTDPSYHRILLGTGTANWAADSNFVTNLNDIDMGLPNADWGYLDHFALCTDAISGDLYAWGEFANPQYVQASYQLIIPTGGLVLNLSSLDDSITV